MSQQGKSDQLLLKVKEGDISAVQQLLSEGADVNYINNQGECAMFLAALKGDTDMTAVLIKNGAQIDLQDDIGWSPLKKASHSGRVEVTKLLLENGAKVDLRTNAGVSTALYLASQQGHTEVAKLLLEHGAAVDLQFNRAAALYAASENGHVQVTRLLLEFGAKVDLQFNGETASLIATINGHAELLKLLLEKSANVDFTYNGYSLLMLACAYRLNTVIKVLLDHDADTYLRNNKGQTALEIAKENNHVDIISLFADLKEKAAYPGLLFSEGVKKESITSDEKTINLEEVGASLTFPKNSLPSNEPPVEVAIQPCFSGSFIMPDDIESMSPAYVIKLNRKVKFKKDVLLKIQHNANLQTEKDCENMVFLSASSTPEYRGSSPVYEFKEITDTKKLFISGQEKPYGEIQLNHFSIFTTGMKLFKRIGTQKKLYSARLFRTEKSAVFCMCLYQPLYMQSCENVIASKYMIKDVGQGPIEYNAVTLSSDEVTIKITDNSDWKTDCTKNPKISRTEIEVQEVYKGKFEELQRLGFPPRIDIGVSLAPMTPNPKPLELHVEGLNSDCTFKLLPGDFITKIGTASFITEIDTAPISDAIKELDVEIKTQVESCSSNILAEATKMMDEMTIVESLLKSKKPTSIVQTLERMECTGQQLRNAAQQEVGQFKVTYDMEKHIEAVNTFTRQLRVNYGANIKHTSGDAVECQAATQLFIANSANLMNSIKELIKASKSAHALPKNQLTTAKGPALALLTFTNGFKLMEKAASKWEIVAANLRLDNIENIKSDKYSSETEKASQVFTEWLNNAPQLNGGKYPKTWKGLEDLLNDSELAQVRIDFLNALDK